MDREPSGESRLRVLRGFILHVRREVSIVGGGMGTGKLSVAVSVGLILPRDKRSVLVAICSDPNVGKLEATNKNRMRLGRREMR